MDSPPSDASDLPRPSLTAGQRLFLLVGSIGPLGYLPASGTAAVALAGVPLYWVMVNYLTHAQYAVVTALVTAASILVHHLGDKLLGESDSRKLVWDELVGFFIAMYLVPFSWPIVVIAFFLERAIDIGKVPPANLVDRHMHNGVGVVLDDVIAGIYTCLLLHLLVQFFPTLVS